MATLSDSDVAGVIESLLGLASSTKCSTPPAAESCPFNKPMKEVILEGITKEIDLACGLTENPYGMKNKILQKWQTNFSWLNRNMFNYYLHKTRPPKIIQLVLQAEVSDLTESLAQQQMVRSECSVRRFFACAHGAAAVLMKWHHVCPCCGRLLEKFQVQRHATYIHKKPFLGTSS